MISKTNNPLFALRCFLKGFAWLSKKSLRKFLVVPILINFILYTLAFVLAYLYLPDFIAQLIPEKLHWLSWLITPLFFIFFSLAGFFSFTLVANLIAAPFYGRLAARTLLLLKPEESLIVENELAWQTMMFGELRRLAYLVKWMLALAILSLIPVVNVVAPILWAMFGAWSCALEYLAYPLDNKKLAFPAQKDFIQQSAMGALSLGGLILLGLGLPIVNICIAPAAVIAATLYSEAA